MAERLEVSSSDRVSAPRKGDGPNWMRRMLTLAIAVAAVGGFALVVVYSYDQGDQQMADGKAPVITAENGPTKVRPEAPGGMDVPNQDKQVYGQLDTAKRPETVERLLPPPEPVARKPEPMMAADAERLKEMEREQARIAAQLSAVAPAAGESKPALSAPPAPPPQIAAVPHEPMGQQPAPKPMTNPAPMKKSAKAAPAMTAAKGKTAAYRIQIASLKSEAAAKTAWTRLTKGNKDLLGKLEPNIVRIELAGKGTFYRLQAGPVDDASAAKSLCSNLKKRKIGCLVVRP